MLETVIKQNKLFITFENDSKPGFTSAIKGMAGSAQSSVSFGFGASAVKLPDGLVPCGWGSCTDNGANSVSSDVMCGTEEEKDFDTRRVFLMFKSSPKTNDCTESSVSAL